MTDHVAKQILDQVVTTCTGRGRTRFIKELERMSEMDYSPLSSKVLLSDESFDHPIIAEKHKNVIKIQWK